MKPGPAPRSAHLKLATGNPGKRQIQVEPEPAGEVVKPKGLPKRVSDIWDQFAPIVMEMGLLKSPDVILFANCCRLAAKSQTQFSKMSVAEMTELRRTLDYFGMTAPGRARMGTKPDKPSKPSKEESYFGAAG